MKETLSLNSKITEINETQSNDIYMKLSMCILTNNINLNNCRFTDSFIQNVVDNSSQFVGIPLVANREVLEDMDYENLTHELNMDTGQLETDIVGSFTDFYSETDEDGTVKLMGDIKVFKRFPETCEAIKDLFTSGDLRFSCEVMVKEYASVEDGIRTIDAGGGELFASAIVFQPAEILSEATLLIAEAYKKDMSENESGETMSETKYNNGIEVKLHNVETASIALWDVENYVYNQLNPIDPKSGDRTYNYYIYEVYNDKVIVSDRGDKLYSVGYKVENDSVVLDAKDTWVSGSYGFIPSGTSVNELNSQINKLKEDIEVMSKDKTTDIETFEAQVKELQEKVEGLEKELSESNALVVSEQEAKAEFETTISEMKDQITELSKYKEQVETAEKEAKVAELNTKYSKVIDEETFKSEAVQKAIAELNEVELDKVVVAQVMAKAEKVKTETASKKTDEDVTILASKQEDLVEQSTLQKYGF